MKRPINIFVIESEEPSSKTSVRGILNKISDNLKKSGSLGKVEFKIAPGNTDLQDSAIAFKDWAKSLPVEDPIILWISIHGADPEYGVADDKRKYVGTAGVTAQGEEVSWYDFFAPIQAAANPSRIIVLMDVCWGSSPTAPARLTTPSKSQPAMLFGPARPANRNELDKATEMIFNLLDKNDELSAAEAKAAIDGINSTFEPSVTSGTPFYRMWWWDNSTLRRYPNPPSPTVSRVDKQ